MMNTVHISKDQLCAMINHDIPNGRMFSIVFTRKAAKCEHCGKSNQKWNDLEKCPICGHVLSKERYSRVQLGVKNPKNCTKPGQGKFIGESGEEAMKVGRLKYFDMDVVNADGSRGCYRQCVINNIHCLHINGIEYIIK